MKDKDLVLVDWVDSYGARDRWRNMDEVEDEILICHSVGWLTYKSKDVIVVTPHVSEDDHETAQHMGCGDMTIPRVAVKKITKLRKA